MILLGTSNWSGDYFDAKGTGTAIVIQQDVNYKKTETTNIIKKMRSIFERDWNSAYTHLLDEYIEVCLQHLPNFKEIKNNTNLFTSSIDTSFCELEKDAALLAAVSPVINSVI